MATIETAIRKPKAPGEQNGPTTVKAALRDQRDYQTAINRYFSHAGGALPWRTDAAPIVQPRKVLKQGRR